MVEREPAARTHHTAPYGADPLAEISWQSRGRGIRG